MFLLSRSETEFSKHFQKLPRKITPDLAGYGRNFAIGSSGQSIPSQNKPTLPPFSKRPKSKPQGRTKRFGSQARAGKTAHSAAAKSRKNSRSPAQTASETVAPQSRRPVPGLCALSPAGISDASKPNDKKYKPGYPQTLKNSLEMPAKALNNGAKAEAISNIIPTYTGADAKRSAISPEMSKNKVANRSKHTTIYTKNGRKYHRIRKTDHTNQYFHHKSASSAQKYIVATGHRDTKRHRTQQCYPFLSAIV